MVTCSKNHSKLSDVLAKLSQEQGGEGRHRCCGCAYEMGYYDGLNNTISDIKNLPYSQAKEGRHKSVTEAYNIGQAEGIKVRNGKD